MHYEKIPCYRPGAGRDVDRHRSASGRCRYLSRGANQCTWCIGRLPGWFAIRLLSTADTLWKLDKLQHLWSLLASRSGQRRLAALQQWLLGMDGCRLVLAE